MKKISFSAYLFIFAAMTFYACKDDEEIGTQQFVQNYIIGKWPLKVSVNITTKNGLETEKETINHGKDSVSLVVDTVQFLADGRCIKDGDTVRYTVDGTGENITFDKDSMGTWFIKYLRVKSIILTQEKSEQIGSDTFLYYKEEQLIRN